MDFSIVLPSRGRIGMLKNFLDSVNKTSLTKVEVLIAADLDDDVYLDNAEKIHSDFPFATIFFLERNSSVQNYINFLATKTVGDYIFVLNDDCRLTTRGWDFLALEKLINFGDYVYGKTHDNSIDKVGDYSSFPIISRAAYKLLGFVLEDGFGNHGADVVTYRIYNSAGLVVDLPMVTIDHVFHSDKEGLAKRLVDKTAVEMIYRTFGSDFSVEKLFSYDVSSYVKMLTGAQKVAIPANQPRVNSKKVN